MSVYTEQIEVNSYIDYYVGWLPDHEEVFTCLRSEIEWEQKAIKMFGKEVMQPRLVAWYGSVAYTYSGNRNEPLPLTPTLSRLMAAIEKDTGAKYNSVLCNLYRDGKDSIGWHADNERELGHWPTIASLSLGATRDFWVRHNEKEHPDIPFVLESGDLLVMRGSTQETHKHSVQKERGISESRINLTFRLISG